MAWWKMWGNEKLGIHESGSEGKFFGCYFVRAYHGIYRAAFERCLEEVLKIDFLLLHIQQTNIQTLNSRWFLLKQTTDFYDSANKIPDSRHSNLYLNYSRIFLKCDVFITTTLKLKKIKLEKNFLKIFLWFLLK